MKIKQGLATGLLLIGVVLSIIGFSFQNQETRTITARGQEIVVNNSDAQSSNWRLFIGVNCIAIGIIILAIPINPIASYQVGGKSSYQAK
jgi:hypothetical protein